jgi:hypothetical protein
MQDLKAATVHFAHSINRYSFYRTHEVFAGLVVR